MANFTFVVGDYLYTALSASSSRVHAQAHDKTKTSYANVPSTVTYAGRNYTVGFLGTTRIGTDASLPGCFQGCSQLITAPALPSVSGSLNYIFADCVRLETAPIIPDGVTSLFGSFSGCARLVTAPAIPSSVTHLDRCFAGCVNLQGNIEINAEATLSNMFQGTQLGIWLTGSSSRLQEYAATATNGNVFVGEIPLSYMLAAERVAASGGLAPAPEGRWLHLTLSLSWSNFATNSIESISYKKDGLASSVTWYTDSAHTAVIRPPWKPAATTEAHAWVPVDLARHSLSIGVSDTYHAGETVTLTVPPSFRTIDFLRGGKGIAFGKIATNEGFECAMPARFEDDLLLALDTTATSGVDKEIYDALVLLGWDSDVIV